ncbi:oxygen-independent coproporphyrinogen III oxidase [Variovorax soli]|uniref:Coproporphyrinogen-III oxidase n=1 Tax=Variovorax soli TaxID=376815 RepID=A0ABU1NEI9_9BURK|nr:oxygen-independent coproporphyrinogen III oxidase [Variovorax soli]MDR6536707.1 oxygen-independent coproporphyrinogen-3 oxidase [Variovorax soli]
MTSTTLAAPRASARPSLSAEMLARFDVSGPRYTSYPTADRFVEAFGPADYSGAARQRRLGMNASKTPISLYVHIPFCASLCYYCACNKIITRHASRGREYLRYLEKETALHVAQLGAHTPVSQLHLGGGTPTFLSDDELTELMRMLRDAFSFAPDGEYAIEIDPRTVDAGRLAHLARLGFNRLSFGVQDFDPDVQQAVHRIQPAQQVFDLVASARALPFQSINVDLIYGLPRQTSASFDRTLKQICALRPDRIALYAYAHLPERFKPQRRIAASELPYAATKVEMLSRSIAALTAAGYVYIGMDHFALPDDSLAVAKRQGRLHRNFQGYSTQPDCDLVALGVSAIGRIGSTYSQNAKSLEDYYDHLDQGRLPVARGLALSRDDVLRRSVIMAIMCQGYVDFESVGIAHLIDFRDYFASELDALDQMEADGLVRLTERDLTVTDTGWFFVRAVAMVFDRYLQTDRKRARFSRII